jgi:4a-hydroxytetrahydrobiopterin dehydratase
VHAELLGQKAVASARAAGFRGSDAADLSGALLTPFALYTEPSCRERTPDGTGQMEWHMAGKSDKASDKTKAQAETKAAKPAAPVKLFVEATPADKLSEAQIEKQLAALPEWSETGGAIQRTYQFKDFIAAMAFVGKVAAIAEDDQHHPDIMIRYNKVTLNVSTHSAGGITMKDFDLARKSDTAAG